MSRRRRNSFSDDEEDSEYSRIPLCTGAQAHPVKIRCRRFRCFVVVVVTRVLCGESGNLYSSHSFSYKDQVDACVSSRGTY